MEDIRNAINSLEITLIRHGNEGLITDVFSAKTLKMAIKALEKQAFFENWLLELRNARTDIQINEIWKSITPSKPTVSSDLTSYLYGQ